MPLLRIVLSTGHDLISYDRDHGSSIHVSAHPCDTTTPDLQRLSGSTLLTRDAEPVWIGRSTTSDAAGRYVYHLYLDIPSRAYRSGNGDVFIDHDYRRDHSDICLTFSGGQMLVGTHHSRDFRISYALIADALARAGLPHAAPRAPLTSGS